MMSDGVGVGKAAGMMGDQERIMRELAEAVLI